MTIFLNRHIKWVALLSFLLLIVLLSSFYLPLIYRQIFFDDVEKTHLFYSPVSRSFIFTEMVVGDVPTAVREKAEDHHSRLSYKKVGGEYISRVDFEKHLPFVYYKNMEIWGLLPLHLNGKTFGKKEIKRHRRVIELKAKDIRGNSPECPVWPILESNPGQARLVFPDDRFYMSKDSMVFINADTKTVDHELTKRFTTALIEKGFSFPARSVNGKFTVLKPFDEGVFIVDNQYHVFHVKRINGAPRVKKTPINPKLKTRFIKISESKLQDYYGLLLGGDGRIFLFSCNHYELIPLPLASYVPDKMDVKLILNPLYCTAVYSDSTTIFAVAMDNAFQILDTFSRPMSRSKETSSKKGYRILFPFVLDYQSEVSGFLSPHFIFHGWAGFLGVGICLLGYFLGHVAVKHRRPSVPKTLMVVFFGLYGLIAVYMTGMEN